MSNWKIVWDNQKMNQSNSRCQRKASRCNNRSALSIFEQAMTSISKDWKERGKKELVDSKKQDNSFLVFLGLLLLRCLSVCCVGVCVCDSGFTGADCSQQHFATISDTALLSTQERKCRPGLELWTISLPPFRLSPFSSPCGFRLAVFVVLFVFLYFVHLCWHLL